ncbi:HAMP domain-containing sensor histidine kinase [Arcobacter sp. LA11]|uniref:sensor histidine kinase n=1 Tax=Arcobacter sp. LA11 TaxID=1898176 RepID=UPI00093341EE|nr:HAMP domain-containing sensor histidine kinase [Arcobacter sp. LA11]
MKLLPKITIIFLLTLMVFLSTFSYLAIKNEKASILSILKKEGTLILHTISSVSSNYLDEQNFSELNIFLITVIENYDNLAYLEVSKDNELISRINKDAILNDNLLIFKEKVTVLKKYVGDIEIGLSQKEYDKIIDKNIKEYIILVLSLFVFLFIVLIYIVKHFFLSYINKLKTHMELIGSGEYHESLKISTSDEFEELSNSINDMSKHINESYINLQQLTMIQDKQKKDLEEANKSKDDFLANMSHELKTPLNSINIISSVMTKNKDNKLEEEHVKNLKIINSCGNDLLCLINDVLDVSKLEAKEVSLNYETIDFYKMMYEIKDMIEPQVLQKNLIFEFDCNLDIDFIYSDKNRIKQVLKNFLSNSLKFVEEGKIKLAAKDEDENIRIYVEDNGIGIPEDRLEKIFERFKQVDGSTTRKYGGTGLGLAICKEIIELLNGTIEVTSKINEGSTFSIVIPKNLEKVDKTAEVKEVEESFETLIEIENEEIDEYLENTNKKNILFLHDEPINYLNIIVELKIENNVTQVSSLLDLTTKIDTNNSFDLIIIDINKLDLEKLKEIMKNSNNRFIIIYNTDTKIDNEIENSASLCIDKTLSKEDIIKAIKGVYDE